jgi:glycosyltransferase involved in cell wall biosynthesis
VVRELRGVYLLVRLVIQTCRYLVAGRRIGRFDVVHANDFETLPAAWWLAREGRARLVYDAHELYAEQEANPSHLYRAAVRWLERSLAKRASAVATVSPDLATTLHARLALDRPPFVVLNCPELQDVAPPTERSAAEPLRAIYQAGMGTGRLLDDLLRAAELAPSVEITLRVLRSDPHALQAEIDRRGLASRVHVEDPVRSDRLIDALIGFDVGLVIDRPVSLNNTLGFPNKLFEYLMAGLAVVVPRLPTMGAFVEREEVGLTFEPGRPDGLADALTRLSQDRPRLLAMRTRAREIALERFNAEAQYEELARAWGA